MIVLPRWPVQPDTFVCREHSKAAHKSPTLVLCESSGRFDEHNDMQTLAGRAPTRSVIVSLDALAACHECIQFGIGRSANWREPTQSGPASATSDSPEYQVDGEQALGRQRILRCRATP